MKCNRSFNIEMDVDPVANLVRIELDDIVRPAEPSDDQEYQPVNCDDWQSDRAASDDELPCLAATENDRNSFGISEEPVERMQLRHRDPAPIPVHYVLQKLLYLKMPLTVHSHLFRLTEKKNLKILGVLWSPIRTMMLSKSFVGPQSVVKSLYYYRSEYN